MNWSMLFVAPKCDHRLGMALSPEFRRQLGQFGALFYEENVGQIAEDEVRRSNGKGVGSRVLSLGRLCICACVHVCGFMCLCQKDLRVCDWLTV